MPLHKLLAFALVPLVVLLAIAELGLRLSRGALLENYRQLRLDYHRRGYPATHDPELGYAPRPDLSSTDNFWGTRVSIDGDGYRSNGSTPPPAGPCIVATGDSFTFGDQVDDDETWPAFLERELGQPVKNGGVFGYGFDQAVLRAEQMLERHDPQWVVVSLIGDDLTRSELSRRYTEKPYFELVDGALALRNVPIATEATAEEGSERFWKDLLGSLALLDALMAHSAWKGWYFANDRDVRVHAPGTGLEIGHRLVERLAAHCRAAGASLLLVVQGQHHSCGTERLLARARERGVMVLDLVAALEEEELRDAGLRERYFDGHMTAEGNRWAARHIAAVIRRAR